MSLKREQQMMMARCSLCSPLTPFFDRRRLIDELFSDYTTHGGLKIQGDDDDNADHVDIATAATPPLRKQEEKQEEYRQSSTSELFGKKGKKKFKMSNANNVNKSKKKSGLDSGPLAVNNKKGKKQRSVKKAAKEASEATIPDISKHTDEKKGNLEVEKKFEEGIFELLTESWQLHGRLCNDLSKLTSVRVHPSKKRRKQIFDALAKKGAIVWGRRRKNDNVIFELEDITSFEGFQTDWYLKLGTGVE